MIDVMKFGYEYSAFIDLQPNWVSISHYYTEAHTSVQQTLIHFIWVIKNSKMEWVYW